MDFLNKTLAQLTDLFRSMTVGARITTALLLAMVVISLGYLFVGRVAGPEVDLMNGVPVSASHLPAMQAAFGKAKLSNYEIRGSQVFVPRGLEATYMAALADAGAMPPDFGSALRQVAEGAGNPFISQAEREARTKDAIQRDLALIVSRMSGIESAYVMYATETKGGLNREKLTTASVMVKPRGNGGLDEATVAKIRHFVAGAVAGLKPENVTIADDTRAYVGNADPADAANNLYLTLTSNYEKKLREKILNSLSYVPNVTVEPSVVLDRERITRTTKVQHDPKTVPLKTSETTSTHTRDSAAPAGRPGYISQQANAPATLGVARSGNKEDSEEATSETINAVSGTQEQKETVGLTPKRVSVAVGIPTSYFEKVWRERNDEPGQEPKKLDKAAIDVIAQEESVKIRKHVAGLLPPVEGVADATELVTVTAFQDIKAPEIPGPSTGRQALAWLGEYWSTLAVIGVAVVSLVVLRSLARSAPLTGSTSSLAPLNSPRLAAGTTSTSGAADADADPTAAQNRLRRFQGGGGKSLRDELSDLVKEDPDTAANILNSWIGPPA